MDNLINKGHKNFEKNLNRAGVDVKIDIGRTPHLRLPSPRPHARPTPQPNYRRYAPQVAPHRSPALAPAPQAAKQASNKIDINLRTLWFLRKPMIFPPSLTQAGWDGGASMIRLAEARGFKTIHTLIAAIRHSKTLAIMILRIKWEDSDPKGTARADYKIRPPPHKLSKEELDQHRGKYSGAVARWCENHMGRKVGNGECWTLAANALEAVGAMRSVRYTHGALIYRRTSDSVFKETDIARGDIVQFWNAKLRSRDGLRTQSAGMPGHTSVVTDVEGRVLQVVECNIGHDKRVQRGEYDLGTLVAGSVEVYRAVGNGWAGELEAVW